MNVLKLLFPNMQIKMGNMETIYQSNGYKYKNKLKLQGATKDTTAEWACFCYRLC